MTFPNFLIIGAAKSGTSSLYMYLKQHPQVFMSPVKEPHFFSFNNQTKMTTGPGDPIHEAITDFKEYEALFDGATTEKAVGEASTSYLYRPEAPERIHDVLPDVKLIAILRNPADRAFSAYMHVVRDQRETAKTFSEALALEKERKHAGWEPIWHFTSVGRYYEQLSRYYALFNRDQIRLFLYEDLAADQENLLREVYQFLNVNADFTPGSLVRYNVSGELRSKFMNRVIKGLFHRPNPIRWLSRKIFPEKWRLNAATWVRHQNLLKRKFSPEVRRQLIETFREDILKLQDLINKDLSQWLE